MRRLEDRVAVIVGAGQSPGSTVGNGRATAVVFARAGARLVLVDRDEESLEVTVEEARSQGAEVLPIVADITSDDGPSSLVAAAKAAFGQIDVLHNNVGTAVGDAPAHRLSDETYDRMMDVNLRAMWRTCRAAIPEIRTSPVGSVVNVSSLHAAGLGGSLAAYTISKAGVNALTRSLAAANARYGVRVNAIMPGLIDTPTAVEAIAQFEGVDREVVARRRDASVPLGHQGTAWDVANAAAFLASSEASFITGVVLPVDGGQLLVRGF